MLTPLTNKLSLGRFVIAMPGVALSALLVACGVALPPSETLTASPADHPQQTAPITTAPDPAPSSHTSAHSTSEAEPENLIIGTIIDEPEIMPDDPEETIDDVVTYDVPIVLNESVEGHLEYFQTTIKERFAVWLNRSHRYLPLMKEIFKQHGLPEDLVFVALIESGFNPHAYSRAKAVGPWQFISGTGRRYGLKINEWIDERRDPVKSTDAAARYLKDLYGMFQSWPLALASYNAGENRVARAIAQTKTDDFWKIKQTRYLRPETRNYVPKFMAATIIAKNPEKYGFWIEHAEPLTYDEVTIDSPTDLRVIAKAAGVSYDEVKQLNPELRQGITPLYYPDYRVKIPQGSHAQFIVNFDKIPKSERLIWVRHRVRQGESLSVLARRYGTTVKTLQDANRMGRRTLIRVGRTLVIPTRGATGAFSTPPDGTKLDTASMRKQIYRVRRGDTLWDISRMFGVTVKQIQRWNKISTSRIRSGQKLTIYIPGRIS